MPVCRKFSPQRVDFIEKNVVEKALTLFLKENIFASIHPILKEHFNNASRTVRKIVKRKKSDGLTKLKIAAA